MGQEVLLAVRVDYDIAPDGPPLGNQIVLLRNADGGWREIDEQPFGPQRYGFSQVALWGDQRLSRNEAQGERMKPGR